MTPVAADNNEVCLEFLCLGMDFYLGPAHYNVPMGLVDAAVFGEAFQLLAGLLVNFILDAGKIHRDVAAVGEAEGLYHMNDVQLRRGTAGNSAGSLHDLAGILAEIDRNQDLCII